MFRYRIAYPRPTVDMTSPDGMIDVEVGDATIPNYQTPAYIPYGQKGPPIAPYTNGDVFAGKYGLARFSSMCQSLELKGSAPTQPKYNVLSASALVQTTAGTATFVCEKNGQPMSGYVYAETSLVRGLYGQPSNWYVTALGSYLAPAAEAQAAADLLKHSADSMAWNPELAAWQKYLVTAGTRMKRNHSRQELAGEPGDECPPGAMEKDDGRGGRRL